MATKFTKVGEQFFRIDPTSGQRIPSNQREYLETRAKEQTTGAGKVRPGPPARDISPPSFFRRQRQKLVEGFSGAPFPGGGGKVADVTRGLVDFILPETEGATARDAALLASSFLPVGKVTKGPKLLRTIKKAFRGPGVKATARIVAPPVAASSIAAATGGDPVKEGAIAAGGSLTELLGIPIRKASRGLKKLESSASRAEVDIEDIDRVGESFGKAVPAFKEILQKEGRAGIATLADPDQGRAALSKVFAKSDARIKKAFGKQKITIEKAPITMGTAVQAPISVEGSSLTAGQLLQKIKDLKQAARDLPFGSTERRAMQADADKFEGVLKKALTTKDVLNRGRKLKGGSLLVGYNKAVKGFRQGLPLLDLSKKAIKSGAIKQTPTGFALDQAKFSKLLETTPGVTAKKFPGVFAATSRGNVRGAADEIKENTIRTLVKGVAAANLPLPPRVVRAGTVAKVGPGRGQLPASLTANRLFELLAGNPTGGR